MIAFYTIAQGQQVAVWDRGGRREIVAGPKRILTWHKRVQTLEAVVAGPTEYLVVRFRDGLVVHVPGPAGVWVDPVEHESVTTAAAVVLDANESVVVYRHTDSKIDRRVLRGPARFVPTADEWLHEFRWHGAEPGNPRHKVPRALTFNKLRVIPDQMYFDVDDVRTSDDAVITVKLMVFFELVDIETMLDQTHDPVADFINALAADVIDFVAGGTFEQFKERTERMNDLETYKQLTSRAGRIGYRINKVVYRGYQSTAKLQAMHDGAIEARTRLKLEAETEQQAQELADMKLARERQRGEEQARIELGRAIHLRQVNRVTHDEEMHREQTEAAVKLAAEKKALAARLQHAEDRRASLLKFSEARYRQRVEYLKQIGGLNVDMTRFLVARHEKPDKRIRIDGAVGGRLNLHEQC
jgi:hypothetical protein